MTFIQARRVLGYEPVIGLQEGIKRGVAVSPLFTSSGSYRSADVGCFE
jgi:hypothetical protein